VATWSQGTTSTALLFWAPSPPYTSRVRRAARARGRDQAAQLLERPEEVACDRPARLHLRGHERRPQVEDDVDLEPGAAAEEMEVRGQPAMDARLQDLGHHPVLEQRSAQGMLGDLLRRPDPQQRAASRPALDAMGGVAWHS